MKMLFKQRFFSWLDSYDIFDEWGNTLFTVRGQLAWGHCLKIFDTFERERGTVRERVFSWLPTFELYEGERLIGSLKKEFSFFRPRYDMDFNGWHIEGDFMEWDYRILDASGNIIAVISKELFKWTDTYSIEVSDDGNALYALMFVLAVDAEKCSRN